ncbi:MAG: N-acetylneuraminate synthase family protein [Phycisphaerales bacterium]
MRTRTMHIGARSVGDTAPPFVIAEIGVNHDGDPARALRLVDAAADAGADAVKVQHFRADLLMSAASTLAAYQANAGERDPREMLRRLELNGETLAAVAQRARERGLLAIATVFSVELVDVAARVGWDAYKFASPDIVHRPLIERVAALGTGLIVSTGAADADEVARAHEWLREVGAADRCVFLQCVSSYPAPDDQASLGGIGALLDLLPCPIGYSDHTPGVDTGALAVCAGATMLEKHLTYDRSAAGPDHAASLDPEQFREYVRHARRAHAMLGPRTKRVLECEHDVRRVSRQSLVARRTLRSGETISPDALTVKRPGLGLPPHLLNEVVGRAVARDVAADTPLTESDLA